MTGNNVRQKYLAFMEAQQHEVIPSSRLVPENDPTTLFTGSGMQPLVTYLMGAPHPKGTRVTNSQKCFRAEDIDEVGDNRHTTFFEMLGNWSFGDYFKKDQLTWFFTFLTKDIELDPQKLYVTCYSGNPANNIPKDEESASIWQTLFKDVGIDAKTADIGTEETGYTRGMHEGERIFFYEDKNWWSRAGKPSNMPAGEPGGPDSEVFYDFGTPHDTSFGAKCHPNCDCGRFLEIGNSVFMEFVKNTDGTFSPLPAQNVDFGGGLERILAAHNGDPDVFKTDLLWNNINALEDLSGKTYDENKVAFRVITDHIRGAVFMIGDRVHPSNTEQGYFVRRLLRRSVRYADVLGIPAGELKNLAESVITTYENHYTSLSEHRDDIIDTIAHEEEKFRQTLEKGLKEFNKIAVRVTVPVTKTSDGKIIRDSSKAPTQAKYITGENAFNLFTTYGFPVELTEEIANERGMTVDMVSFKKLMDEHRNTSRAGAEQKFKGGLADNSEKVVQYHTTTHLMLAGLRKILGEHVHQAGSNITAERLRFDFTHPEKVSSEDLQKVEDYVNTAIKVGGKVTIETMKKDEAEHDPTIEGSFWDRYPDEVNVYVVKGNDGTIFSRELCGGPHVHNLSEIQGAFKIQKEEASSAGVRRIKAILA